MAVYPFYHTRYIQGLLTIGDTAANHVNLSKFNLEFVK
ncbi:Uncharacterised protein [Legionella geestiana]|nr:Uncharacterised protein [Legionella geestiana]